MNVHYYYIPITQVEGWDGKVLWLNISEEKVKMKYERSDSPPDPSRYHLKDSHTHNMGILSELRTTPSKIAEPAYSFDIPVTTTEDQFTSEPAMENVSSIFKCDLCNKTHLGTGDDLSNHIRLEH